MNWLDIVLAIILVVAAIDGYRKGLISQAFGIAGLLLGILLGYRFSTRVAGWLDLTAGYANLVSFIIILVCVIIVSYIVGRVVRKIFRMTGFGILDHAGGLILGVLKIALIMCLLLNLFVRFNNEVKLVNPRIFNESFIYKPMKALGEAVFPWMLSTKDKVWKKDRPAESGNRAQNI